MPVLLHLDSSADPLRSRSREVTAAFAAAWAARGDDHSVVYRDLHAHPLPHLADASLHWPGRLRAADAPALPEAEALQRELLDELLSADVLLLGAPMYNYSLPSTLKAWIDNIHVPGVTAPFDVDSRPLAARPAVIVSARGGIYDAGSETADWDHVVPPLKLILGAALGMDVHVITASRTLAETVPAMEAERETAQEELDAARARAIELARSL